MATKSQRKRKHARRVAHQRHTRPHQAPPAVESVNLFSRPSGVPIGYLGSDEEWLRAQSVPQQPEHLAVVLEEHDDHVITQESRPRKMHLPTQRGKCPECRTSQKTTIRGVIAGHGDCAGKGMKPLPKEQ